VLRKPLREVYRGAGKVGRSFEGSSLRRRSM
jgi:hypothetical protein